MKLMLLLCDTCKRKFYKFYCKIYSMSGEDKNLDGKMKQLSSRSMYEIYASILKAMKKGGIKAERQDNAVIIDIGHLGKGDHLTIRYDKARESAEIDYKLSGKPAEELTRGIGQHFPILEGLDKLANNLEYVRVWTTIKNKEKKCENSSRYCRKIGVYIDMIRKSYSDPKQDETQPQQPTELGVKLAKSLLEELIDHAANYNIDFSIFDDGTTYITRKDNKEPIFIQDPIQGSTLEWGMQSYTISGELAKDLIEEIGRYIPLPRDLKEAKKVRVIWDYSPEGYTIGFYTEMKPRKFVFK